MANNHNPSTHINSLSKTVIEQLTGVTSDGDAKTQIVDGSDNVIGSTSNALDVNVKSDGAGLALDDTLTDGSQKTQIVDGDGDIAGVTDSALDTNIKGITIDDPVSGSVDLSSSLYVPTSAGQRLVYGLGSIQMLSSDISDTTAFYLELSLDQTNWDNAVELGVDVEDTLVRSETKVVNFESTVGIYWRIRFANGNTGNISYYTLG